MEGCSCWDFSGDMNNETIQVLYPYKDGETSVLFSVYGVILLTFLTKIILCVENVPVINY